MPTPCWPVYHSAVVNAVHHGPTMVSNAVAHVGRRFVHHVRHSFHASATHAGAWVETVCKTVPSWIAHAVVVAPLVLPLHHQPDQSSAPIAREVPVGSIPDPDQPFQDTQKLHADDGPIGNLLVPPSNPEPRAGSQAPVLPPAPVSAAPFIAPATTSASAPTSPPTSAAPVAAAPVQPENQPSQIITILPRVIVPALTATAKLAPYIATPAYPANAVVTSKPLASLPQSVPEPSSLLVLASAALAVGALSRRRIAHVPQNVARTRSCSCGGLA